MRISYRKCQHDDLTTLVEISKSTYISAFQKQNNPIDFEQYLNTTLSKETIQHHLNNPDSTYYFISEDDTIIGYFKLNENDAQTESFDSSSIELERLFIIDAYQGLNIGEKTLKHIVDMAHKKGVDFLWLGVWECNPGAIRFYERHGFVKFGTHPYMLGSDEQTDWLMKYEFR